MAGTVIVTTNAHQRVRGNISRIRYAWTCDASGNADGTTGFAVQGLLLAMETNPDGSAAPTDNYDVTVTVDDGAVDILGGAGANRHTSSEQRCQPLASDGATIMPAPFIGKPKINVSNAGNAKSGVIDLYILNK